SQGRWRRGPRALRLRLRRGRRRQGRALLRQRAARRREPDADPQRTFRTGHPRRPAGRDVRLHPHRRLASRQSYRPRSGRHAVTDNRLHAIGKEASMYGAMRERAPNSTRMAGLSAALLMTAAVGYALANGFIGNVARMIDTSLTFTPIAEEYTPV